MELQISKREQNKLQRRGTIVEIATRAFLEQGYAATSMSAIADELGGSKATLWSHFASKEELFTAVIDRLVVRFGCSMENTLTEERFSLEGLRRYCLHFLFKLMGDEAIRLFRLIVADGGRFPEIVDVFHVRAPARIQRLLASYLATEFDASEAGRLARIINAALVGYRSHALTRPEFPSRAEMEQFVDDFIAHLRLPAYRSVTGGDPS
jgi:AcrR family transcriptional regulator